MNQLQRLSPTGWLVVQALTSNGNLPMSSMDLAIATGSSPLTIALVCRDLTKRGITTRVRSEHDCRRTMFVMATTEVR